jgi:hypothetical protein
VKDGKKAKFQLGVAEPKLGSAIQETTSVPCVCNEFIGELLRGIRAHFTRFIDNLKDEGEARPGLGGAAALGQRKWLPTHLHNLKASGDRCAHRVSMRCSSLLFGVDSAPLIPGCSLRYMSVCGLLLLLQTCAARSWVWLTATAAPR